MRHACILTVLLVLAPAARADPHAALTALEQSEPSLREVRMAALRDAGLDTRPEASWSRRSRLTGLMPVVTLTAAHDTGTDHGVSRSSSGTERLDMGTDEDFGFQARAVWHLDRLLFSDTELRAVQAAERRQRARAQLLARVTSVYFQRRKLQLTALWAPVRDPGKAALHALAVAELTAQLDAMTGGYFTARLAERASATRPGRSGRAPGNARVTSPGPRGPGAGRARRARD